jgi:phage terminase large subunit-like protein
MNGAWDLSRPDWAERIRRGDSLLPDLPLLNKREADRATRVFGKLRLPDVPGKPRLAVAAGPWFIEIVRALFGSLDPVSRQRMIREIFLLAPKKSSKTSYGAGLMLTALLMNERPRSEYLFIAPTKMIADLAFDQACGMIEADPYLRAHVHIQRHLRQVTDARDESDGGTGSQLKIKAFDTAVLAGTKPLGVLCDELFEIARDPSAARVIGQVRGGLLAAPESFLMFISTAADEPPRGIFLAELSNARAIRDGTATGRTLPILFEFPGGVDWRDSANWWMVTPNRDRSVTIPRLIEDFARAELTGEHELVRWASQHLNLEMGMGLRSDAWSGAADWQACGDPTLTLDSLLARSEVVTLGYDEGGQDDLLGFSALAREPTTRQLLLWCHAWCCEVALERRKSEQSRWRDFASRGELTIVPNMSDGLRQVADLIQRVDKSGRLPKANAIGVDAYGGVSLADELAVRGISQDRLSGVPQGWKLNSSIRTLERRLAERGITHGASTLMDYCVANAKIEVHCNAISITKAASGSAKIDPLVSALCALHMMNLNPEISIATQLGRAILQRGGFA